MVDTKIKVLTKYCKYNIFYTRGVKMKTIKNAKAITIKTDEKELINGKWMCLKLLSEKVKDLEKSQSLEYKALRVNLYNSVACDKYNISTVSGVRCIDTENPMKAPASLEITFTR